MHTVKGDGIIVSGLVKPPASRREAPKTFPAIGWAVTGFIGKASILATRVGGVVEDGFDLRDRHNAITAIAAQPTPTPMRMLLVVPREPDDEDDLRETAADGETEGLGSTMEDSDGMGDDVTDGVG